MIPKVVIDEWRQQAPWPLDEQVEQDLIISRALVELFNHEVLKDKIAFRGGTALHKLVFPRPLRYSEDIDLNRLEKGPATHIIDGVREALDGMLGQPKKVKSTQNSIKMLYDYESIGNSKRRLKVEINTRETLPEKTLEFIEYQVESEYFSGKTTLTVFNKEEMIGTKIRALYQRNKGRDLFDLYQLSELDSIDWSLVVASFEKLEIGASAKNIADNLDLKMQNKEFLADLDPLLPQDFNYNPENAYHWFQKEILSKFD